MGIWIFRDKKADIRSIGQLFSLYNSLLCSILSIYYLFTGSVYATIIIGASLCSYLIADMYYGFLHYHHIMCSPNGYAHHIVYILIVFYLMFYNIMNFIAVFCLCEIATFFLNIKYVFGVDSFFLQLIILLSFILFRVLFWGFIIYKNSDIRKKHFFLKIVALLALGLHIQWTWTHACKIYKKFIGK